MAKPKNPGGRNRAEKRAAQHQPKKQTEKPMALRIIVLVLLGIMFLGFFLMPLLR